MGLHYIHYYIRPLYSEQNCVVRYEYKNSKYFVGKVSLFKRVRVGQSIKSLEYLQYLLYPSAHILALWRIPGVW